MVSTAIKHKINSLLEKDNDRSRKVLLNTIISFVVKGGSIIVGLMLIPMTINYINPVQYGIWLTVSSIVGWMSFFDVGMGHGLRNNIAQCLADNNLEEAKKYVSTTYAVLTLISSSLFVLFIIIIPLLDWRVFLNIPAAVSIDIQVVILVVFCSFCIQFVVQLLNTILLAVHASGTAAFIAFLGQIGVLIGVFLLTKIKAADMTSLVLVLTSIPIMAIFLSGIYLFRTTLKDISPSIKYIDFSYAKKVLGIGGAFFVIQIGALALFQTDNIIITKVIGPKSVTEFNVAYKLFSVIIMVFSITITPYWSAFTDAYAKQDFIWIEKSINLMRKVSLGLSILTVILCLVSKWVFRLWLGHTVLIDYNLSIAMTAYVIIYMWQTTHVYLLNGIGKIRLQLILVVTCAIINIPLAIYLGNKFGNPGVISANSIVFAIMTLIFYWQTKMIIEKRAVGIWNK